ncbi:hypothetical protein BOX15_Mlig009471g1, partial [Macrostomum lignano]
LWPRQPAAMLARVNELLKQFATRAPHLFYTVPIVVGSLGFYAYRRAKCLQLAPETIVPFRHYYFVARPQDINVTEENAPAYNWEDLRAYRNKYYPNLQQLPKPPTEPGLLPLHPYPRINMQVPQEMEDV